MALYGVSKKQNRYELKRRGKEGPEYQRYRASLRQKEIDNTGKSITRLQIRLSKKEKDIKEIIRCRNWQHEAKDPKAHQIHADLINI